MGISSEMQDEELIILFLEYGWSGKPNDDWICCWICSWFVLNVQPLISVLFVDDELAFSTVIKQCLDLVGSLCVETTSSADEAIEKMKEKTYDVIVSDRLIPGKDGIQFLKELREEGKKARALCFS